MDRMGARVRAAAVMATVAVVVLQVLVSPDGLSFRPCWLVMNVDGIWMVKLIS